MNNLDAFSGEKVWDSVGQRLRAAGIHPNKTLGQNFLINAGIYEKLIAALELTSNDTVLEIGSGLGTLTDYLLSAGGRVIAVEKDPPLIDYLRKRYRNRGQVEIIGNDILRINPLDYSLAPQAYKVVGNIPYYLTSHLFQTIFETWPMPERLVFMIQKEVAQRIVAKPPAMSLLAVSIQYYTRVEIIARVARGSFLPPPKVDSAIIRLRPYGKSIDRVASKAFFRVVKAGFAGKRKQLVNNLVAGLGMNKATAITLLQNSHIDPRRRAETLTLEEWQKLTDHISLLA